MMCQRVPLPEVNFFVVVINGPADRRAATCPRHWATSPACCVNAQD